MLNPDQLPRTVTELDLMTDYLHRVNSALTKLSKENGSDKQLKHIASTAIDVIYRVAYLRDQLKGLL